MSSADSGEMIVRVPVRFHLSSDDHATLLLNATSPRSRDLLKWLAATSVDSADLLDWLGGSGIIIQRHENPAIAILHSLPSVDDPLEYVAREVLVSRLADAIEWVAELGERLNSIRLETWIELFDLARRLSDELLRTAIVNLRIGLDRFGSPFNVNREISRELTDLVIMYQCENELEDRWLNLISGNVDPILYASLLDAMRGLITMPTIAQFESYETAYVRFFLRNDGANHNDINKSILYEKLLKVVRNHPIPKKYLELIAAENASNYSWLPRPTQLVHLLATTTDLAVLDQIAKYGDELTSSLAKMRYLVVCERTTFPSALKEYISRRVQESVSSESCEFTGNAEEALDHYGELVLAGH